MSMNAQVADHRFERGPAKGGGWSIIEMFTTYVLKSLVTGKYYVGFTSDINDRLRRHNSGANKSTRSGIPWKFVYQENFSTKKEAWLREHKIKLYKGGEAFKRLVDE